MGIDGSFATTMRESLSTVTRVRDVPSSDIWLACRHPFFLAFNCSQS
jgi:hypothetical protein